MRFNDKTLEIFKFNSIYLSAKKEHVGKITFERIKKSHKTKGEKEFVRSKGQSWKATRRKQEIALECRVMFEKVKKGGEETHTPLTIPCNYVDDNCAREQCLSKLPWTCYIRMDDEIYTFMHRWTVLNEVDRYDQFKVKTY